VYAAPRPKLADITEELEELASDMTDDQRLELKTREGNWRLS